MLQVRSDMERCMPRKARIDAPGALHHIIVRGIERRKIFLDDQDREDFVERLGGILTETHTCCLAWALIPNHAHFLFRTGPTPIATVMRRLLTGYAVFHNHRHRRHGHLFQNRYKSILCQEGIEQKQVWASGKHPLTVKARSLLCYWAVRKLGISATELSKKLGISQPSVSISVKRGENIAKAMKIELADAQ